MKRVLLLLGILFLLIGCVNGIITDPACPDCGDLSQADPPQTTDATETNDSVENPVRSLGGARPGSTRGAAADAPAEQPAPDQDPPSSDASDAELNALIDEVSVPGEELAGGIPATVSPIDPADANPFGLVDRWGFPLLDQVGPDVLLELFIDGLSFGILPADQPDPVGPSGFTQLERQCIAQGEPEFICRQRYGQ